MIIMIKMGLAKLALIVLKAALAVVLKILIKRR